MAVNEAPPKPGTSRAQLYTWQSWVHVGPEAENCEDVNEEEGTVECRNPLHFHAWVRLPNPHQHRDIRERAMAAKARRMRLYREPDSDLNVILEEEIDRLGKRGEAARPKVTDEVVAFEWWKHILEAQRLQAVETVDEESEELRWEHIEHDRERAAEIRAMHADEQPKDELAMLDRRLEEHDERFETLRKEQEQPLRDELGALDISALLDRLRDARIAQEGSNFFEHTYAEWEWITCTFQAPGGDPVFDEIAALETVPSAVLEAIQSAFSDLNREKGGLALGNS